MFTLNASYTEHGKKHTVATFDNDAFLLSL